MKMLFFIYIKINLFISVRRNYGEYLYFVLTHPSPYKKEISRDYCDH